MTVAIAVFILATVGYLLFVAGLSTRPPPALASAGAITHFYVFVVPALNEQLVIRNTLDSLLALPAHNTFTIVVDDASTDHTAEIVQSYPMERVLLVHRTPPEARQGKGAALNAAYRVVFERFSTSVDRVVLCVVDADGRLEPNVLDHVEPLFSDPRVGAVQLLVRILNRQRWLTRFQDFEFVSFSSLVQRGRQHLGSVGLGGNGQFVRLSALRSLGDSPWSDCLTEDLDLGLRLAMLGWNNRFTAATAVSQQGVVNLRLLWRQRTRWLQGHLQCWRLTPALVRSDLPSRTVLDLFWYLAAPVVLLVASVLYTGALAATLIAASHSSPTVHASFHTAALLCIWYVFAFGPTKLLATLNRHQPRDVSAGRALVLAHLLVIYNYVWYAAAWRALARMACRRQGWTKTTRIVEISSTVVPLPAVSSVIEPQLDQALIAAPPPRRDLAIPERPAAYQRPEAQGTGTGTGEPFRHRRFRPKGRRSRSPDRSSPRTRPGAWNASPALRISPHLAAERRARRRRRRTLIGSIVVLIVVNLVVGGGYAVLRLTTSS